MPTNLRCREIGRSRALSTWKHIEIYLSPEAADENLEQCARHRHDLLPPGQHLQDERGRAAVVDPTTLREYGLQGIRMVDTSIMPQVCTGNTNTPSAMIGERAATILMHAA